MAGQVDSLNVAVAAGVCLYEAVRQRAGVDGSAS
jgi:tRNA G18 (ribose-2'-O)-methylase SpoU